jgi:sugar/nucleoside kinase (ribokinase family)
MPLEDAIRFANAAGALATQGRGSQPLILKRDYPVDDCFPVDAPLLQR